MSIVTTKPTQILLIRHAEKPLRPPPYGVSPAGERDEESLTVQGWLRAGALASLLAPPLASSSNPRFGTPQVIYASRFRKGHGSKRSEQTVTPLSRKLGLSVNTRFAKGDEEALVQDVLAQSGVVLICWQHEKIPTIASHILGSKTLAPRAWPDDRYDLVWRCDLDVATGRYTFQQAPQALLSGDSIEPIRG
jgi:hypothetical protein